MLRVISFEIMFVFISESGFFKEKNIFHLNYIKRECEIKQVVKIFHFSIIDAQESADNPL